MILFCVLFVVFDFAVIMGIMLSQNCGKILVGDPHQQIYTFRGAVNALHAVPHTHIYYLTQVQTKTQENEITDNICRGSVQHINVINVFVGKYVLI